LIYYLPRPCCPRPRPSPVPQFLPCYFVTSKVVLGGVIVFLPTGCGFFCRNRLSLMLLVVVDPPLCCCCCCCCCCCSSISYHTFIHVVVVVALDSPHLTSPPTRHYSFVTSNDTTPNTHIALYFTTEHTYYSTCIIIGNKQVVSISSYCSYHTNNG